MLRGSPRSSPQHSLPAAILHFEDQAYASASANSLRVFDRIRTQGPKGCDSPSAQEENSERGAPPRRLRSGQGPKREAEEEEAAVRRRRLALSEPARRAREWHGANVRASLRAGETTHQR